MAGDGIWPSIKRHGLLSTRALLDLFELSGKERERLYSHHRPESVAIEHAHIGTAVIRDQKPMDDKGLVRSLTGGMSPRDWYEKLNDKVFFWLSEKRLERLLGARAYRQKVHTVMTVDTRGIVQRHIDEITLCSINSGCTKPMPQARGPNTFSTVSGYPFEQWVTKRGLKGDPIVELAVEYAVPEIASFTIEVDRRKGRDILERIWP